MPTKNSLFDKFICPPFSCLISRTDYWQKRKKAWKEWGGFDEDESRDSLVFDPEVSKKDGHQRICHVGSLLEFDPVLMELLLKWFCPPSGKVLDPFASGLRGIVASQLGYDYTGVELRQEQVDIARNKAQSLKLSPSYIVGDSLIEVPKLTEQFDLVASCPPYFDLEVYSDDKNDLSNQQSYEEFLRVYSTIINESVKKLKDNRFACFVVGDIRDKNGFYRGFVNDTIDCFKRAGTRLYNEAILVNVVGSVSLRVNRQFGIYRKLGKLHQNVLVFYKGSDCKNIKLDFPEIDTDYHIPNDQSSLF
jgi:methylase of polypeptide subunit release factors